MIGGQNFLRDRNIARKIADAGNINTNDLVLEIGPGEGILTEQILATGAKMVAVEKDEKLYEFLKKKFVEKIKAKKLVLINDDILSYKLTKLKSYKLIANIPYYITGAILRKFLTAKNQPERMILMLQKEVAERIVAKKQRPLDSARGKESLLSISVKAYGDPKIAFRVGRGAFRPAPKVDSAVLVIGNISRKNFTSPLPLSIPKWRGVDAESRRGEEEKSLEQKFFKILRAGFAHPRKKLSSNLKPIFGNKPPPILPLIKGEEKGGGQNARAENLTLEQWLKLAKVL